MFEFDAPLINRSLITNGYPENEDCWNETQPAKEIIEGFCQIFPRDTSWGDVREFRTEHWQGSVLYVWQEEDKVTDLDVGWTPGEFDTLYRVLQLAAKMKCTVYSVETKAFLEPTVESCLEDWKNTRSARFVENPEKTIVDGSRQMKELCVDQNPKK